MIREAHPIKIIKQSIFKDSFKINKSLDIP